MNEPAVRILCVEDDPTFALIVREALADSKAGRYELSLCETVAEAHRHLAGARFDVLLLDLNLPDSQGLDTLRSLHAESPALPIVVLTVLDDEEIGMCAVAHGADDYLVKGCFDARTLGRALHYAVERRRARFRLEAASRAKDEFLALVAHEFRTPLNSMLGGAQILQLGEAGADRGRRAAEVIERNAQLLLSLIEDLLDAARIAAGSMRMSPRPCHLPSIIEDALETVRLASAAKRIEIEAALEAPPAPVIGDPQRLQQVVWNLLSNAVKFTPEGGRVRIALGHDASHATIEVRDDGRGITPEALPHVFERFVQAQSAAARRSGGLGLGLALVREIVELHGGTVQAESEGRGRGACLRVRLPLVLELAYREEEAPPLRGLRVGIMVGSADERGGLAAFLEKSGAEVRSAQGFASLEAGEGPPPHLVLVDTGVPDAARSRLLEEVRRAHQSTLRGVPLVALAATTSDRQARELQDAGFDQCLVKPLSADTVVPLLAALAGRRPRRRRENPVGSTSREAPI